jgi:hypothetical protein
VSRYRCAVEGRLDFEKRCCFLRKIHVKHETFGGIGTVIWWIAVIVVDV